MKGTVLWFNTQKGYGFIKPDIGSVDVFVHHSGLVKINGGKTIEKDQKVEFDISENEKGKIAINVRTIENISASAVK